MNKVLLLAIALPLLCACSKRAEPAPTPAPPTTQLTDDGGCVEDGTRPVGFHRTSAVETQLANQLFANNGIASGNFRYWSYQRDTLQTLYPPYAKIDEQVVKLQEYANGLIVFTAQINYLFQSGVFHYRAGGPTAGTLTSPTPSLRLWQVRSLFLSATDEFDHNGTAWRPACLSAELGYYNLNAGSSTKPENLVRAWRISPRGRDYPVAYFQDQTGELIYYDNGRRTFTK